MYAPTPPLVSTWEGISNRFGSQRRRGPTKRTIPFTYRSKDGTPPKLRFIERRGGIDKETPNSITVAKGWRGRSRGIHEKELTPYIILLIVCQ